MLTGWQIREARRLLRWTTVKVSRHTRLPQLTVRAIESTNGAAWLSDDQESAIRSVFEAAGVEFIAENGGGAGVRLREVES